MSGSAEQHSSIIKFHRSLFRKREGEINDAVSVQIAEGKMSDARRRGEVTSVLEFRAALPFQPLDASAMSHIHRDVDHSIPVKIKNPDL